MSPRRSPRRSPRLKGLSPKPELPRRPKPPKRVKDLAEDSVRQANFKLELAEWEAEKVEHDKRMKIRKAKATASWKAAKKSGGKDAALPPQLAADELRLARAPLSWSRGFCHGSALCLVRVG